MDVLEFILIILVMDGIFRQRCSANTWDHMNMRRYEPPDPDDALSLSSIDNDDQNDMDLDDEFSEDFGYLFEE